MASSNSGHSRKRPGVEQQKKLIMDAAIALFANGGSRSTSVSQLCKAAEVSRDTFYRCYKDKDELIEALYQSSVNDPMLAVLNAADLDYSDQDWLHRVSSETIDTILSQHRVAQFLFVEASDPNSHAYEAIDKAHRQIALKMRRWSKKKYGDSPSVDFFKAILVAAQWLVQQCINEGQSPAAVRRCKQAVEQLFYSAFLSVDPRLN